MTHDRLLTKINGDLSISGYQFMGALTAVLELHKPIEEDGKLWCKHETCYNHVEFLERDNCTCDYPCPTIQAIEKELK